MVETSLKTEIYPWADVVITIDPPEEKTEEGVAILAGGDDKGRTPEKGIVIAKGIVSEENKAMRKLLDEVEIGDLIFYERYTSNKIPDNGREYNFVRVKNVMGFKKL